MNDQIEVQPSNIPTGIDKMFPPIEITSGELELIGRSLIEPVVQKYLKSLAVESSRELVSIDTHTMTDKEIADAHRTVTGRLETINTLLSIEVTKVTATTKEE